MSLRDTFLENLNKANWSENASSNKDAWIDEFWANYDTQRKNKEVEYISPWTALISGLSSKEQMSDEQAMKMFSKAFNRAKDSSFVDPKGNSLKASEWTDASKNTLLIIMLQHGRNNIAERLIQLYSNVRHSNENGLTPLHAAAATGSIEMCEQLISRGADPLAKIKDTGDYPYQIAEIHGHKKVSEYLLREAKAKHFFQVARQAGSVNR